MHTLNKFRVGCTKCEFFALFITMHTAHCTRMVVKRRYKTGRCLVYDVVPCRNTAQMERQNAHV